MKELREIFLNNPQVGAAIITAFCGIIGIFINIIINIQFRNRDYRNKNKIQQIENMEIYYLPLCEKTRCVMECIQNISIVNDVNLYDILDGKMGAKFASKEKLLKERLEDLYKQFNAGEYRFPDSYKLLMIHRKVKKRIITLNDYVEKK